MGPPARTGLPPALLLPLPQSQPHATRRRRQRAASKRLGPSRPRCAAQNSAKVGFFCSGPPPAGGS